MSVEKFRGEVTVSKEFRRGKFVKKTIEPINSLGESLPKKTVRIWGFIGRRSFEDRYEKAKRKAHRAISRSNTF